MNDAVKTETAHLEVLAAMKRRGNTFWTRIGTAFPTKSGDGYRLKLSFFPVDLDTELLILPPKEAATEPER